MVQIRVIVTFSLLFNDLSEMKRMSWQDFQGWEYAFDQVTLILESDHKFADNIWQDFW